jgi:hypothetical protein
MINLPLAALLPLVALAAPVVMLLACLSPNRRNRIQALLALAPVPALASALLSVSGPALILDHES